MNLEWSTCIDGMYRDVQVMLAERQRVVPPGMTPYDQMTTKCRRRFMVIWSVPTQDPSERDSGWHYL